MIKEYFRYIWRSAHDTEYKFFSNFNFRTGITVLIGYNEGKNLTTYRYFNSTYRIVQFEKDPFLEPRIKAMGGIAGKEFEYFIAKLGKHQFAQTLFVPRVRHKRKAEEATFESAILHQDQAFSKAAPE